MTRKALGSTVIGIACTSLYAACGEDEVARSVAPVEDSGTPDGDRSSTGGFRGTGGSNTGGRTGTGGSATGGSTTTSGGSGGTNAGGDSGVHDGSLDGEASVPDASLGDGSCAAVGTWPPSPATDPKCAPNCDAPSCGGLCPDGASDTSNPPIYTLAGVPCDSGCCATAKVVYQAACGMGMNSPAWSTVAVSPNDRVYCSGNGKEQNDPGVAPGDFIYWVRSDPTAAAIVEGGIPDRGITTPDSGLGAAAAAPQFAFGRIDGQSAVYATYVAESLGFIGPKPPPRGRFGVQIGTDWTFEDIPGAPFYSDFRSRTTLAVDASGAALILTGDTILRRRGAGDWEATCLPDPQAGPGTHLVVDAQGAWLVLRTGTDGIVRVSRRDLTGAWSTESVTTGPPSATGLAITAGAGTAHVLYMALPEAGSVPDLHYARRIGTSWESHVVVIGVNLPTRYSTKAYISHAYAAVDDCGTPHIAVYTGGSDFDAYYFRWTATGWNGKRFINVCDPNVSGGIALTASHAVMTYWSCFPYLASIPL